MEKFTPKNRSYQLLVGLVSLLLFPGALFALDARLSLDNDRYVVGQKITLDIIVNAADPLQVKLTQPSYPPALSLTEGPFIRETSWEDSPGRLLKGTKVSLTFKVNQSGLASLGPFVVAAGGDTVVVPARSLYFLGADEAKKRFPLEVRWQVPQGTFYQGQVIPVMLQVRNLDSLVKPKDMDVGAPASSLWEKALGLGEIEISSVGEDRIMNIPWGSWMLIPTQPGTLTLPPVSVEVTGVRRNAGALDLSIQPLPPELASTRAVGELTYTADVQDSHEEGQILVVQEVHGRGNFPYLIVPEVTVEGLTALSRQESSNYRPTTTGYQGSLTITTKFRADKLGRFTVHLPAFQAFQPENSKTWSWESKTVPVEISNLGSDQGSSKEKELKPLDWDQVTSARPWGLFSHFWAFFLFLPGFLFWLFTFFQKKNRGKGLIVLLPLEVLGIMASDPAPENFDKAMESYTVGNFTVSMNLWDSLVQGHPHEGGLLYNKGLAAAASGQTALAEQSYRLALADGFRGPEVAIALKRLEDKEQLTNQHPTWQGPSLDFFLLLTVVGVNLFFFFWGFQRITGKAVFIIATVIVFLSTAGALGTVAFIQWQSAQVDGVVGPSDGPIKRVPGDLAEEWLTLKRGTTVKALGASGEFVLVQTGYGLEGWVRKSFLLNVNP